MDAVKADHYWSKLSDIMFSGFSPVCALATAGLSILQR
jgi:hypothetical protein